MKPLMGQVQNQAHLDDLLGSIKAKQGNFDRPAAGHVSSQGKIPKGPSFNDMLLASISKDSQPRQAAPKPQPTKIPDANPRIERPTTKPPVKTTDTPTADKPSRLAESTADAKNERKAVDNTRADGGRTPPEKETKDVKNSETSNSEAKAALAPLKKQFNGKNSSEALLNGNAVLSFVSGRLDKIEPDALASIITESSLIKQAMTSGDVASFMQTPMTIAELSKLFEVDQSILNKAVMGGLDSADLVTPKDFVNALGLDAGRIAAELTQLQQRLPAEGIKAYIDRAQAIATTKSAPAGIVTQGPIATLENRDVKTTDIPAFGPGAHLDDLRDKTLRQDQTGHAIEIPVAAEIAGQANPAAMLQLAANQRVQSDIPGNIGVNRTPADTRVPSNPLPTMDLAESLTALAVKSGQAIIQPSAKTDMSQNEFAATTNSILSADDLMAQDKIELNPRPLFDRKFDLQTSSSNPSDLESLSNVIDLDQMPSFSESDPFKDMGQMMDQTTSMKIEFGGNGVTQRTLEELLLDRGIGQKTQEVLMSKSPTEAKMDVSPDVKDLNLGDNAAHDLIKNQVGLENLLASSSTKMSDSGSFADGMFQQQDSSSDDQSELQEDLSEITGNLPHQVNTKDAGEAEFVNRLTSDGAVNKPKDTFASKIMAHAQMMLKNGGGAMRVNVETPGMGKVDVAINLINNQIDVRIITASEQARDMISREVSGLRDGLGQQGISLRGLEVGKAGESSGRQFAGHGQQQFGQSARDQRASYDDMRQYVQSFKNAYNSTSTTKSDSLMTSMNRVATATAMSSAAGRLEVRI